MAPVSQIELGRYIKETREAKGLSLRALSRNTKIDLSALSRLEKGDQKPERDPERLGKIAEELDIPKQKLYAMAGYPISDELPELASYLTEKYQLSEGAVNDMEDYLQTVTARYKERGDSAKDDE